MSFDLISILLGALIALGISAAVWWLSPDHTIKLKKRVETQTNVLHSLRANKASVDDQIAELNKTIQLEANARLEVEEHTYQLKTANKRLMDRNQALEKRVIPFEVGENVFWKHKSILRHGKIHDHIGANDGSYDVPVKIDNRHVVARGNISRPLAYPTYVIAVIINDKTVELWRPSTPSFVKADD